MENHVAFGLALREKGLGSNHFSWRSCLWPRGFRGARFVALSSANGPLPQGGQQRPRRDAFSKEWAQWIGKECHKSKAPCAVGHGGPRGDQGDQRAAFEPFVAPRGLSKVVCRFGKWRLGPGGRGGRRARYYVHFRGNAAQGPQGASAGNMGTLKFPEQRSKGPLRDLVEKAALLKGSSTADRTRRRWPGVRRDVTGSARGQAEAWNDSGGGGAPVPPKRPRPQQDRWRCCRLHQQGKQGGRTRWNLWVGVSTTVPCGWPPHRSGQLELISMRRPPNR